MKLKLQNLLKFAGRFVNISLNVSMFTSLLAVILGVISWALTGQLNWFSVVYCGWNAVELVIVRILLKRWRPKIV